MISLLEAGIDPCSLDNASELMGPCFGASVLRMEVSESNFCLQLQFECQASGPLVQQDYSTKQVLEIIQSFDVVFSLDRSSDRFTGKPVSQTTGLLYVKRGIEAAGFHWTGGLAGKHFSVIGAL